MSGGVDSTVAAVLLKEQGHDVIGVTMRLWDGGTSGATPNDVVAEAAKVARQLDIPFHSFDMTADFRERVVQPFCGSYLAGSTPNPCIICNRQLKFGRLLEEAERLGADALATGHYARVVHVDDMIQVRKGRDLKKDQSYFLFALTQNQLRRCLFPLGDISKDEVRAHAAALQLSVAEKSESQDICFIPDGDYVRFLESECSTTALRGELVHVDGQVLGHHSGAYRYTIGQRKGLGIGWSEPLYVISIDAAEQRVIVGEKKYLSRTELTVCHTNWSIPEPDVLEARCRLRYRHKEAPARVDTLPGARARIVFAEEEQGITPGQAAVFYLDDRVVGGGWIE